jgi:5,10-methenyltetrahydrofolate synthetase
MLSRRDALTAAERAVFAETIAERVDGVLAERRPAVLAMYAAKGSEVATAAIDGAARARGVRVVYPRIVGAERRLVFCEVTLDEMVAGRFGIAEPREDAPAIELGVIEAFLVPGVAFERQMIDGIAHEPHDVAMNLIITEVATHVVA